jgi:hypothetical protein
MPFKSIITTIADSNHEIPGEWKYWACVCGADDCIYGIPTNARKVLKFDPRTGLATEIGPDLGADGWKWKGGVLADNGCIYCAPLNANKILKINTIDGMVTVLDVKLPESGSFLWAVGARAADNCIYFAPCNAHYIMKFNPTDESCKSVGHDFGEGCFKYCGLVALSDEDGSLICIPNEASSIIRFYPSAETIVYVGGEADEDFLCCAGLMGLDGYIYAPSHENYGLIKIDVVNNSYTFCSNSYPAHSHSREYVGWGVGVVGNDGCLYWPPYCAGRTLKFDTQQDSFSLVGSDFGEIQDKWGGGAATSDGRIYCIPCSASHILVIDPFMDFSNKLKGDLIKYPEDLGNLFVRNDQGITAFESAIAKFGCEKVLSAIKECLPAGDTLLCKGIEMKPFMVAVLASCGEKDLTSALSVIYYLLKESPHDLFDLVTNVKQC